MNESFGNWAKYSLVAESKFCSLEIDLIGRWDFVRSFEVKKFDCLSKQCQ
jgi:hypothetical protein